MKQYENILDLIWSRREDPLRKVHFYQGFVATHALNYAELWAHAQQWRDYYVREGYSGNIVISLPTSPEFFGAFFGAMMAGLVPVPVASADVLSSQEYHELVETIQNASDACAIINRKSVLYDSSSVQSVKLEYSFKDILSDVCFIQFSSGSTSDPKGVILEHSKVLINLKQITDAMRVQPNDSIASWLPLYHDMGLIGGFLGPLYCAAYCHYHSPIEFIKSPEAWLEFCSLKKVSVLVGPDFMYKLLADRITNIKSKIDLSSLRICMTGSEPVSYKTCSRFLDTYKRFGLKPTVMMPVYGMAEAVLGVTFSPVEQTIEKIDISTADYEKEEVRIVQNQDQQKITVTSCGRPLEGIELEIRDDQGRVLNEDRVGQIWFKSPSQTRGFYNNDEATESLIKQGWIKTGDIGFIHNSNLYISGREKDIIVLRGKKIHAIDIERKVLSFSQKIRRAAVVSIYNAEKDFEEIFICAELRSVFNFGLTRLKQKLAQSMSSIIEVNSENIYLLPDRSLPRTSSGKLKRYMVKQWIKEGKFVQFEKNRTWCALENKTKRAFFLLKFAGGSKWSVEPLREEILNHFTSVTAIPRQSLDWKQDIFSYGIDSLKLMSLLALLEKHYGQIPITDFYQFKNLEDVYQYIRRRSER